MSLFPTLPICNPLQANKKNDGYYKKVHQSIYQELFDVILTLELCLLYHTKRFEKKIISKNATLKFCYHFMVFSIQ